MKTGTKTQTMNISMMKIGMMKTGTKTQMTIISMMKIGMMKTGTKTQTMNISMMKIGMMISSILKMMNTGMTISIGMTTGLKKETLQKTE